MKHDPFDRVMPTPGVYYYLWYKIIQRTTESDRVLSDYLLAVAETEWIAVNAATWIQQMALSKRMMRIPPAMEQVFRNLGYEAPLEWSDDEWSVTVEITPNVYRQLLDIHDAIDWEITHLQVHGRPSNAPGVNCPWLPFNIYTMALDVTSHS